MDTRMGVHDSGHPSPAKYTAIALILAVITLIEVAIVYMGLAIAFLFAMLATLSVAKFAMVAMYFMHLKFDHRLFSVLFVGGLLLTCGVVIALLALFAIGISY